MPLFSVEFVSGGGGEPVGEPDPTEELRTWSGAWLAEARAADVSQGRALAVAVASLVPQATGREEAW